MWQLKITETFARKLEDRRLRNDVKNRINDELEQIRDGLIDNPDSQISLLIREPIIEKVRNTDGTYKGRRTRIGDYRLFYWILFDEQLVIFYDVRHRSVAYR